MKTDTSQKILEFIKKNSKVRPHDLGEFLKISQSAVHRQLKSLISSNKIVKVGQAPLVFYVLKQEKTFEKHVTIPEKNSEFLEKNYLYINPEGKLLWGVEGFVAWVTNIGEEKRLLQLSDRFVIVRKNADNYFNKDSFLDASFKFTQTFDQSYVDMVFYQDFYSLPEFGKTILGQLVLHAKQAQHKVLIAYISKKIETTINEIIKKFNVDAVGFVPHSIPRKVPFLKELRKNLTISIPHFSLVKAYSGEIPMAQKSLGKLSERIDNAKETIFVKDTSLKYKTVLLIDDAVGSGATFNETAKKLKTMYEIEKVICFAVVGSMKGFEVIKEV